jgi:dihydrofolate reductase
VAVIGSPGLMHSLLQLGLVDELKVMIDPVVIGSGKTVFGGLAEPLHFDLSSSVGVTTGATLNTYVRSSTKASGDPSHY